MFRRRDHSARVGVDAFVLVRMRDNELRTLGLGRIWGIHEEIAPGALHRSLKAFDRREQVGELRRIGGIQEIEGGETVLMQPSDQLIVDGTLARIAGGSPGRRRGLEIRHSLFSDRG